jgi:hypothetical protein
LFPPRLKVICDNFFGAVLAPGRRHNQQIRPPLLKTIHLDNDLRWNAAAIIGSPGIYAAPRRRIVC